MDSNSYTLIVQGQSLPHPTRCIGQDLTSPFTIYVDGSEYADFPSLAQADAVYMALRQKMGATT